MYRVKLINQIEKDLLDLNKDSKIKTIQNKIDTYSELLQNNIKNFYELESMDYYCPLFKLCFNLRKSSKYFDMSEEEFNKMNENLLKLINSKYEVNYTLN